MTTKTTPAEEEQGETEKSGISTHKKSIFSQYAQMFRILLARWIPINQLREEERIKELKNLILPSNEDWRQRVYYRLVELQRECDAEIAMKRIDDGDESVKTESIEEPELKDSKVPWEWGPGVQVYPLRAKGIQSQESATSLTAVRGIDGSMTEACVQPGWRINDILLAANVLRKVQPTPVFSDEAEMRRVFGLVYDVLRYKNILNRALEDVGFWVRHNAIKNRERIVWLLLYDMQGRKFARRGELAAVKEREKVFKAVGLMDIENALLEAKTHLAASVSRLRIGGSALNLDELLPTHLRIIEGVSWGNNGSIASGWVNTMKVSGKNEFLNEMSKLGFVFCDDCQVKELDGSNFVFDPICPKIINIHEDARERLACSSLVRDHHFVFLERSLCLGAAALAQAIRVGRLCGPVVLTHSVAPRHTGYLAGLLADIEDAGRLLAFGAGDRRYEYETYLKDLGVTLQRCRIFSETYASPPPSAELERATVVLAVPPCSYTGVKDIVDLAVARGGDTDLLESLTSACSTSSDEFKQPRALLADQLSTLKYALTRPNVQFLIYEAHTILPSETTEMIRQVVEYANRMAMEKYIRDHPPKKKSAAKEGKASKLDKLGKSQEENETSMKIPVDVSIPDKDLFEVGTIDDIYGEHASSMLDPGCFLAVIRRKEMMQFDSLFMIKVAESKGLFGDPNQQQKLKREPVASTVQRPSQIHRKESKRAKIEFNRIMAPTYSSLLRNARINRVCPRHERYDAYKEKLTVAQEPTGHGKSNDPGKSPSRRNLLKTWRRQSESVKRLSMPIHRELRIFYPLHGTEALSIRSESQASSPERTSKRGEGSSTLAGLLQVSPFQRMERSRGMLSSTALRSPDLAKAIQRIPLETDPNVHRDEEFEKCQEALQKRILCRNSLRRENPREHSHLPTRNRLETLVDQLHEFSRLLSTPKSIYNYDRERTPDS